LEDGKGIDPIDIIKEERLKDIPEEFRKYIKLFKTEEEVGLLLKTKWDYVIELKLGI